MSLRGFVLSTLLAVYVVSIVVEGCGRNQKCVGGSHAYYFGEKELSDIGRKRRSTYHSVFELSPFSSFIKYRETYFVFGENGAVYRSYPGRYFSRYRAINLAGYSDVSLSCIQNCTNKYVQMEGSYSMLTNNCHTFANKISWVLCTTRGGECPAWCLD